MSAVGGLSEQQRATLAAVADHYIPAAHGMPSAAEVLNDDRLRFVLSARPDLVEPLSVALRAELGDAVATRLESLASAEPDNLAALQLVVVAGYYSDKRVRELIGYAGQEAIEVRSWIVPEYIEEGLVDAVVARGPVWRDPSTGRRVAATSEIKTYAERFSSAPAESEGGS